MKSIFKKFFGMAAIALSLVFFNNFSASALYMVVVIDDPDQTVVKNFATGGYFDCLKFGRLSNAGAIVDVSKARVSKFIRSSQNPGKLLVLLETDENSAVSARPRQRLVLYTIYPSPYWLRGSEYMCGLHYVGDVEPASLENLELFDENDCHPL